MLKLHFINVGDGDALLVEELNGSKPFRMMVDVGRDDVGQTPGSLRCTAGEYLRALGVTRLDLLVVTHLHIDHFGGLTGLLDDGVEICRVWSGFFPSDPGRRAPERPESQKTVRGLTDSLNRWCGDVSRLRAQGCQFRTLAEPVLDIPLTGGLRIDVFPPDKAWAASHWAVWEAMLAGERVEEELAYAASKFRNPGSLRLRLTYAGRSVVLCADCGGEALHLTDREAGCDILKVPHHANGGALTGEQIGLLCPRWAVISCEGEYIQRKDRPSRTAVERLEEQGARVWITDGFDPSWRQDGCRRAVEFTITDDGGVLTPCG